MPAVRVGGPARRARFIETDSGIPPAAVLGSDRPASGARGRAGGRPAAKKRRAKTKRTKVTARGYFHLCKLLKIKKVSKRKSGGGFALDSRRIQDVEAEPVLGLALADPPDRAADLAQTVEALEGLAAAVSGDISLKIGVRRWWSWRMQRAADYVARQLIAELGLTPGDGRRLPLRLCAGSTGRPFLSIVVDRKGSAL